MFTPSQLFYENVLLAYYGGLVVGAPTLYVDLFSVDLIPTEFIDPVTLTTCDFSGYAQATLSITGTPTPVVNADGTCSITIPTLATFAQTGTTLSDNAFGYKIFSHSGGTQFLGGENWNSPIAFNGTGRGVSLTFSVVAGPAGIYWASSRLLF